MPKGLVNRSGSLQDDIVARARQVLLGECAFASACSGVSPVSDSDTEEERPTARVGVPMRTRVKWFNSEKGFGFVAPLDGEGTGDAFVHASALQMAGLTQLSPGAEVTCEIVAGARGLQVLRILDQPVLPETMAGEQGLGGLVKWFAAEKGFGFILADDGGKDIFIHKNVLRRCGIDALADGQRVLVDTAPTLKGREAVWIAVD